MNKRMKKLLEYLRAAETLQSGAHINTADVKFLLQFYDEAIVVAKGIGDIFTSEKIAMRGARSFLKNYEKEVK